MYGSVVGLGGGGGLGEQSPPTVHTYVCAVVLFQGGEGGGRLALRTNPRTAHIYVGSVCLLGGGVAAARRPNIMSIISIRFVIVTIVSVLIA